MKIQIAITFIALSILISCHSGQDSSSTATTEHGADFKKTNTEIPFAGSWISEEYLNKINVSRSPRVSQGGNDACFIEIPERTLMQTTMIHGFHQGGADWTILRHGDKYDIWNFYGDSVRDFVEEIALTSPTRMTIQNKTFVKIDRVKNKNPGILEEILFKGKYVDVNNQPVEFKNTGEVTGLEVFHYYNPIIDYNDRALDVDQLGLGVSDKHVDFYGFKFNKDTLAIYQLKCLQYDSTRKECGVVDFGDIAYKLIRTR